jgi:hypothetical protein
MGRPIKILASLFFILFLTFILARLALSSTQTTFVLDPDNPLFRYDENSFNNSYTSEDLIFSGNTNITRYIKLPKNSTVVYSKISMLGEITPSQTTGTGVAYLSVAVGNISGNSKDDIAIGAIENPYLTLFNSTLDQQWIFNGVGGQVNSVDIGDILNQPREEVVLGSSDGYVYVLNSTGSENCSFNFISSVSSVNTGNISTDTLNEIAIGGGSKVTLINSTCQQKWTYSLGSTVSSVAIGELNSSSGNEVLVGAEDKVYIFSSTGSVLKTITVGNSINSVGIGDITTDSGNEIVVGLNNGTVFSLTPSGTFKWGYNTGGLVYSISIGDTTSNIGNEVAVGSADNKIYQLDREGNFIWSYTVGAHSRGVAIGEITQNLLNETVGVSTDKNVYILNFNSYPTNVSIDVGNDGDYDWNYSASEKLRAETNTTNSSVNQEIQAYLDSCGTQTCDVPIVFHSDDLGNLNVTNIQITYDYNASESISSQFSSNIWSRINNTLVNSTVGNQVTTISYTQNPANSITVNYVKIDDSAVICDFAGFSYPATSSEGKNVCDIANSYQISSTGDLPNSQRLWDDTLTTSIPSFLNETMGVVNGSGIWIKNMTIYTANDLEILYNITANTTLDETYVTSDERLLVYWNGIYEDLTPATESSDCDSPDPTYTKKTAGSDDFFVCKKDTNNNTVIDFFKWKQAHTSAVDYRVEGSTNYPLELTNMQVNSTSTIWGEGLNFSVDVGDYENNNATISLLIYLERNDSWQIVDTKNMSTNGTIFFITASERYWTGENEYKFEYQDYNTTTGIYLHFKQNTTASSFNVNKHAIEAIYSIGDNTNVNRTGTNSTTLAVRINDTSTGTYVGSGVNCSLWVTTDGSTFNLENQNSTNSSGHCNFIFDPNATYQAGIQNWIIGVDNDGFYNSTNSSSYTTTIHAPILISFHSSSINQNVTRGNTIYITAALYDENNNTIPASGYTCTFYINDTQVSGSAPTTNSTGHCYYPWTPTCSNLTNFYPTNVTLSGSLYNYYHIVDNKDSTNIGVKDTLSISIILPENNTIFYQQETVKLNSTISDSCGVPGANYTVGWYFENYGACPGSNPVSTSLNTTWDLAPSCDPREQNIIVNATGDLYISSKDYRRIFIYGWTEINITSPPPGNITNRSTGQLLYTDIICNLKDNKTLLGIENYNVSFFDGVNLIGTNLTDTSGTATYKWNISDNNTVPEGNHSVKCNISESSTMYYNISIGESGSWMIIRGGDFNPPYFTGVHATSTQPYNDIIIEANVTDWGDVDQVWAVVTYPNSTNVTYRLWNISENIMTGTWRATIINISDIGAYDYTVYANDTSNQLNSTTGWFDIYDQLYFWGNATNKEDHNLTINFTFYRPGTDKKLEISNSYIQGGSYNFSVFKSNVDMKVKLLGHEIFFRNVNITSSAISQFDENTTNITNPLIFDNVSVQDIQLQATTKNKMVAIAIDNNLQFENATIELNFTKSLDTYADLSKPALRIYTCSAWQLENRTGCIGDWTQLTTTLDSTNNILSSVVTNMSAFVAVEYCPSCGGGGDGNDGDGPGGGSNLVGIGGGGGSSLSNNCGNGICEIGENVDNCPEDCGTVERPPFSIKTNLTDVQIEPGQSDLYAIWIKNTAGKTISNSIQFTGSIFHFLEIEENYVELADGEEEMIPVYVTIPASTEPAVYTGEFVVTGTGYTQRVPVTITVPYPGTLYLDVVVETLTKKVSPNSTAVFHILIYNLGFRKRINVSVAYTVKQIETSNVIFQEVEEKTIEASLPIIKNYQVPGDMELGDYSYEVEVEFLGQKISSADTFTVVKPFWTPTRIRFILIIVILISVGIIFYYLRKLYKDWRASKLRYIFPIDPKALPKGELNIGQIAETNQTTSLEMKELKTHILTAGATGSGKSVSAMVIVEELLEKKIPVVVFDPTAQWTGFVRPCKDHDLLNFYGKFGMNPRHVKPYKGMIYEVKDPKVKIDFKKYMNPGEISVFTLNKLKPGEYDQAVKTIVDTIFEQGWEESSGLQMVIVFDEVHRLLEKYGGKGGYVALEKACREFRKWGIGLIMISQVLSDFKEAVKGNVLTEIQLHTKSLGDLQRIEKKFGEDYAKRVTKLEVGVGMVQNPKYNKGKPYFVAFRPTYHSPHKIPDKELEIYKEYEKLLKNIEDKIEKLKKSGKDVFNFNVELNLAKDKLKKGRFRMAKIYIDSLTKSLDREK